MKRILKFLKTPLGSVVGIAVFVAIGGFLIHAANSREKPPAMSTPAATPAPMERNTIVRDAVPLRIPPKTPPQNPPKADATTDDTISRPLSARQRPIENRESKIENSKGALPISLITTNPPTASSAETPSKNFAPFGRLIPCETTITLESSKIDTPIIGLVTEDVWHEGRLIIPAGAEVHGRAATDRSRERIAASGQWIIVWRDATTDNGNELAINGIALDRERDDTTGEFGLRDGSAGLVGQVIKTDDWQEIKLFASTFLAGMASGLQDMQNNATLGGASVAIPQATAKNAALAGASDILNAYAAQIQKQIQDEGFYVRVPAGKQFYLYVTQTLDKARAARGNGNAKLWSKNENTKEPAKQ